MIPNDVVLTYAEQAGFGSIKRASLLPRLQKFADMIAEYQNHRCADACIMLGNKFSDVQAEFNDGQMDGAYQCAEAMTHENLNPLGLAALLMTPIRPSALDLARDRERARDKARQSKQSKAKKKLQEENS